MRRFKLLTWGVSGLNNKIFNLDDEVLEGNFPQGHADELVSQGFLKEIPDEKEIVVPPGDNADDSKGDGGKAKNSRKK